MKGVKYDERKLGKYLERKKLKAKSQCSEEILNGMADIYRIYLDLYDEKETVWVQDETAASKFCQKQLIPMKEQMLQTIAEMYKLYMAKTNGKDMEWIQGAVRRPKIKWHSNQNTIIPADVLDLENGKQAQPKQQIKFEQKLFQPRPLFNLEPEGKHVVSEIKKETADAGNIRKTPHDEQESKKQDASIIPPTSKHVQQFVTSFNASYDSKVPQNNAPCTPCGILMEFHEKAVVQNEIIEQLRKELKYLQKIYNEKRRDVISKDDSYPFKAVCKDQDESTENDKSALKVNFVGNSAEEMDTEAAAAVTAEDDIEKDGTVEDDIEAALITDDGTEELATVEEGGNETTAGNEESVPEEENVPSENADKEKHAEPEADVSDDELSEIDKAYLKEGLGIECPCDEGMQCDKKAWSMGDYVLKVAIPAALFVIPISLTGGFLLKRHLEQKTAPPEASSDNKIQQLYEMLLNLLGKCKCNACGFCQRHCTKEEDATKKSELKSSEHFQEKNEKNNLIVSKFCPKKENTTITSKLNSKDSFQGSSVKNNFGMPKLKSSNPYWDPNGKSSSVEEDDCYCDCCN